MYEVEGEECTARGDKRVNTATIAIESQTHTVVVDLQFDFIGFLYFDLFALLLFTVAAATASAAFSFHSVAL